MQGLNSRYKKSFNLINNFTKKNNIGLINAGVGSFSPSLMQIQYGILEEVRKTSYIQKGDIAYTSGISEIYPSDIPIAKVISFTKNNTSMFQKVDVEILVDLNNLYYVFVIQ